MSRNWQSDFLIQIQVKKTIGGSAIVVTGGTDEINLQTVISSGRDQ